jgi:site-specific recombinase XerD
MKNLGPENALPGDLLAPAPPPKKLVPKDPPLRELVDEYVESRPAENTRVAYRKALDDFLSELKIETLAGFLAAHTADVVRYRNALQKQKLAPSTINQRLVAVRGVFSRLLKEGKIDRNPADAELVSGLRVSDVSKTEGLSLEEVERMVATCDGTLAGYRDKALLMTLYYQGLRRSEASKLNYRDLVTRRGLLEVRDAKNNPYDTVRLRPEVKAAIEAYLEVLNRELRRRDTRAEDPVFVSLSRIRSFGKRLSPVSINVIVKARAKAAGIERRVSAHGLRHTCATHGLSRGVPLHQVQRHLRHKDIRTTLRYDRERDVRKNPMTDTLPPIAAY